MTRLKIGCSSCTPLQGAVIMALALIGCDRPSPPPPGDASDEPAIVMPAPVAPDIGGIPDTLVELDEGARSAGSRESGLCSFDKLNEERFVTGTPGTVSDPAAFSVSGWVGDKRTMSRPDATLRITQVSGGRAWEIDAGPGTGRQDVARHFESDGLRDAGFEVAADLTALPSGEYALSMTHKDGATLVSCDKGARIVISN